MPPAYWLVVVFRSFMQKSLHTVLGSLFANVISTGIQLE